MQFWKKTVLIFFGSVILIFSFIIIFRPNGLIQLNNKKKEMVESAERNAKIKKENEKLYHEIVRLKSDPQYLEDVARKELGMIKDDEIIIRFHSDNKKQVHGKKDEK